MRRVLALLVLLWTLSCSLAFADEVVITYTANEVDGYSVEVPATLAIDADSLSVAGTITIRLDKGYNVLDKNVCLTGISGYTGFLYIPEASKADGIAERIAYQLLAANGSDYTEITQLSAPYMTVGLNDYDGIDGDERLYASRGFQAKLIGDGLLGEGNLPLCAGVDYKETVTFEFALVAAGGD